MRIRLSSVLFVALLGTPLHVGAQSVLETIGTDVKNVGGDIFRIYTAPFHMDADDLPELGIFTGAVLLAGAFDEPIKDAVFDACGFKGGRLDYKDCENGALELIRTAGADKPWASFGDAEDLTQASLLLYAGGLAAGSRDLREAALGCLTTSQASSTARHLVYELVSRPRPRADTIGGPYDIDFPGGGWLVHAFPNGHGANAMACASYLNHRFDLGFAEPLIWAAGGAVLIGRIVEGNHWASDTVVGGTFGFLIGKLVAERMLERQAKREGATAPPPAEQPSNPEGGAVFSRTPDGGMYLGYTIRF